MQSWISRLMSSRYSLIIKSSDVEQEEGEEPDEILE